MKKRTKRLATVMLAATMLGTAVPSTALAAVVKSESAATQSGTTGDCTWMLDDEGTLTISGNGDGRFNIRDVTKIQRDLAEL